MHHYIADV